MLILPTRYQLSATAVGSVPVASASASPLLGVSPLAVSFTGAVTGGTAPYTHLWTFGDGATSAAQSPAHTYSAAGAYTARYTVTDAAAKAASATVAITVTAGAGALVASAAASPVSGPMPLTVAFTGAATGGTAPYTYAWDFGDSTASSAAQNPTHVYYAAATFTARLTVTDAAGATAVGTRQITTSALTGDVCVSSRTDYYANPLDLNDAFHRPIGDTAQYAGDSHVETVAWLRYSSANLNEAPGAGWSAMWSDGAASLPLQTVKQRAGSNQTFSVQCRFPDNWNVGPERSGGYLADRSALIYERPTTTYPYGRWHEFWQLGNFAGPWEAMNYYVRLGNAMGHGPSPRGASAAGISLILGMFRGSEWNATNARCEHALAIACPSKSSHGTYQILGPGIVWPATARDNSGASNLGPCPYGRLLAIPPQSRGGPNPDTLGLGAAGSVAWRLYWVLVNYGIFIVDQSGGNSLRADQYVTAATASAIRSALGILYRRCRPVLNVTSAQTAKGGGNPLSANCAFNRTSTPTGPAIQSVAYWESLGSAAMGSDLATFGPLTTSAESLGYYTVAYSMTGHVAMYRATGLTKYLDRALLYTNNMISRATTQAGGYLGWKSPANGNAETSLYEVFVWRYVCEMLDAMKAANVTGGYLTQYNNIFAFTERNIFTKWHSRSVPSNIYRSVMHICSHWATISNFIARRSANATIVAQATAVCAAIDHVGMPNWNNDSIRNAIGAHPNVPGAAFWRAYWPKRAGGGTAPGIPVNDTRYGSDTNHGGDVLSWIVEAYDRGYGPWTSSDIDKFISLFNAVWPAGDGSPYEYFIASGTRKAHNPNTGFLKLGRYSRVFQKRLEGVSSSSNMGRWGNMALNAKILGA